MSNPKRRTLISENENRGMTPGRHNRMPTIMMMMMTPGWKITAYVLFLSAVCLILVVDPTTAFSPPPSRLLPSRRMQSSVAGTTGTSTSSQGDDDSLPIESKESPGDEPDEDTSDHRCHSRRDFLTDVTASSLLVAAGESATLSAAAAAAAATVAPATAQAAATTTTSSSGPTAGIDLPEIGLGAWAWGDAVFWGYNPSQDKDLNQVFDYAVTQATKTTPSGKLLLDSAELYGLGRSESLIGDFAKDLPADVHDKVVVATKFAPLPLRTKPENVVKACEASARRLSANNGDGTGTIVRPIDLYQIHFPMAYENEAVWDGLAMAYERGLVKAVGVSNYGVDAVRACHAALSKRGVPLATNQIQYSLLYRFPEDNGLLQACRDLDIKVLAYSPLALGLLTGKYPNAASVKENVSGPRKVLFEKTVERPEFSSLLNAMQKVTDNHQNVNANLAQVAINWCRAKGTIPIPGARNLRQVQSNFGSLDWRLSAEEVALLDQASSGISYTNPGIAPFPKVDKNTGLVMFDS